MKLKKLFPKNKKGLTLVELVFGVVILSIFALGIITALTTANTTIAKKSKESSAHAEATQMLDTIISTISNGDYEGQNRETMADNLLAMYGYDDKGATLSISEGGSYTVEVEGTTTTKLRGWILALDYEGVTVTGYASNTKGVFDEDIE